MAAAGEAVHKVKGESAGGGYTRRTQRHTTAWLVKGAERGGVGGRDHGGATLSDGGGEGRWPHGWHAPVATRRRHIVYA